MNAQVEFGLYLAGRRAERDLSVRQVAARAGLRASGAMVSFIEKGRRSCGPELARKLVKGLALEGAKREEFYRRAAESTQRRMVRADAAPIAEMVLNSIMSEVGRSGASVKKMEHGKREGGSAGVDFIITLDSGERLGLQIKVKRL